MTSPAGTATLTEIATLVRGYSFATSSELVPQNAVQELLHRAGVGFQREKVLSARDRIEFYLPEPRAGIECKIDGSVPHVAQQLLRYAASPLIDGLLLVTSRNKHRSIPPVLGGKPVYVILTRLF